MVNAVDGESTSGLRGSTRPNFLLSLPDELLNLILQHLSAREQLSAAIVCTSLQSAVDEIVAVGELSVAENEACSDRQLLWLSRSYRGRLCLLDVSGCASLSKVAISKAARRNPRLKALRATRVGGASWSADALLELVNECPRLESLDVDCKADLNHQLFEVLSHRALRPRKLTLQHKQRLTSASTGDLAALAESLGQSSAARSLQEVDAAGSPLRDEGVAQLARLLTNDQSELRRLSLPFVSMRGDGAAALATALKANQVLEELELGCNGMGPTAAAELGAAVGGHASLRHLAVAQNPILDAGAAAIGAALQSNRRLARLELAFTGASDGACAALARALAAEGSALAHLDLCGNAVGAAGCEALAVGVRASRALRTLLLSANPLGPAGGVALAGALPRGPLRTLSVAGCKIGAGPCGRIAHALPESSLAALDLSNNAIGDVGAWALAWALESCAELKELRLASNEIEDDGAAELRLALAASATLALLDLRGNKIAAGGETHDALAADARANVNFQLRTAAAAAAVEEAA